MNSDSTQEIATPRLAPLSDGVGAPVPVFATRGQTVCCGLEANAEVCIDPVVGHWCLKRHWLANDRFGDARLRSATPN